MSYQLIYSATAIAKTYVLATTENKFAPQLGHCLMGHPKMKMGFTAMLGTVVVILATGSAGVANAASLVTNSNFSTGNSESNLRDEIERNWGLANFSWTSTETADKNSSLAKLFMSRGATCSIITHTGVGRNLLGGKLYTYNQNVSRCLRGSTLVSAAQGNRWGTVHAPFWEWVGNIGRSNSGPVKNNSFTAWTQGHFKFCLGGNIGCIQQVYPWIESRLRGSSHQSSVGGGGLFNSSMTAFTASGSKVNQLESAGSDSFLLSHDLDESNKASDSIFLSDDLDESTKAEAVALLKNYNSSDVTVPEPSIVVGLALSSAIFLSSKRSRKKHPENTDNVDATVGLEA